MIKKRPQLALARGSKIRISLRDGYEAPFLERDIQAPNCDIYYPYLMLKINQ